MAQDKMPEQVRLYNAQFAFPDPDQDPNERPRHERSTSILFTATDPVAAVEDAIRFFRTRQRAVPDHFGELWCLKVGLDHFGPINAGGCLVPQHSAPFFEWKVDRGALEDYVESFKARKR